MNTPILGEIIMTGFDFAPPGYALCNGQSMTIADNPALFAILGSRYGGDGVTTFSLPDLRGRVPVSATASTLVGTAGGEEAHALTVDEMPEHAHKSFAATDAANTVNPTNAFVAPTQVDGGKVFEGWMPATNADLGPQAILPTGAGEPHDNMQPSLVINFCIAVTGMAPLQPAGDVVESLDDQGEHSE